MPRFYFNVVDHGSAPDREGMELADASVARIEAVRLAGEMLRHMGARHWDGTAWRLEVADARGAVLFVLRVSAEEHPAPAGSPPEPGAA